MIRIYSGNLTNAILHSLKVHENVYDGDLDHQEPVEQLLQFDKLIEKNNKGFCLITNSAFILNYLNLLILKNIINYNDLEVLYFYKDNVIDLKSTDCKIVDTNHFSDVINQIYDEYDLILRENDN